MVWATDQSLFSLRCSLRLTTSRVISAISSFVIRGSILHVLQRAVETVQMCFQSEKFSIKGTFNIVN